jgi:hypothetical protein
MYCELHIFSSKINSSDVIVLLSHCFGPTITETFGISWDELFYTLLISVRVLCCLPSCQKCFHLATILKFVAAKNFTSALETGDGRWEPISHCKMTV